jgi:methylenetetrahydrofolate dehydrogenase (NADP+)/methenyltetrahydrofolate cyclohydrolase
LDKVIDCSAIAQKIKDEVKAKAEGKGYKLTVLTNPHDEASKVYVRNKKRACEYCGIEFEEIPLHKGSDVDDLHRVLLEEDEPFIIQLPISSDLDKKTIDLLDPMTSGMSFRDADGFMADSPVYPATPRGVMRILKEIDCELEGKHVVVVGRSDIVGKPVAKMCLDKNATVTVCHSKTKDLAAITSQADVLIVAVGKPRMITAEHVKDGAVVIDVGINRVDGKLCGDVDFEAVLPKVSKITPVPKGCGLTTVACLMENVVDLYKCMEG